tara:strand:+ start:2312 stop:2632 length:321 start_codon:yes stop_codon:yes gene_type:complete
MNEEHEREINQYFLHEEENPRKAIVSVTNSPTDDGIFYYSVDIVEEVIDYGDDGAFKEVDVDSITMVIACEERDNKKTKQIIEAIIETYGFLEGGTEWNHRNLGDK